LEYLSLCHHLVNSGIRHTRYQNASQSRPAHISLQAAINLAIDIWFNKRQLLCHSEHEEKIFYLTMGIGGISKFKDYIFTPSHLFMVMNYWYLACPHTFENATNGYITTLCKEKPFSACKIVRLPHLVYSRVDIILLSFVLLRDEFQPIQSTLSYNHSY
jgi:hypothetical protein